MPPNAGNQDDGAANSSDSSTPDAADRPDVESTIGDTQVTPDPDATVDAEIELSEATSAPPEDSDIAVDPEATVIPGDDESCGDASVTVMSDWEATLDADVEPGHTIKAPAPVPKAKKGRGSLEQTIALKRREVTQNTKDGTSSAAEVADADYQIEELLGEGGMGAVYAARQRSMDRPVAIKVLKPRAARLASSQDAFVSEAVITGKLDHPNIVPIYDVGKQPNDALFYAMKQVEGVEWKERFAENTVSENLDILLRVADAIAFAHARGIIHRDLKPANIMLGPFGEVLVMDWGLAMPTEDHPSRESFPDARAGGTPHYMAPEMADGTERVDRRSDIYLLGAMLFEIVTGKPPHAIDIPKGTCRERVLAVLDAVANNVVVSTDKTGELLDVARKAIATEPADRYQTASEFQTALREYLTHEESIELSARAAERLAAARQSGEYIEFSRARFGFETALEEWQENERAAEGLKETRFDYAKTAFDRGDLDLALSLIDESDSKQKELGTSIQQAIVERDARQQQLRRLRRISLAASLTVAVVAIGAAVWINSERGKALVAQQEEAAQREIAERNEQEAQQQRHLAESERKKAEDERQKAVAAQMAAQESEQNATAAEAEAMQEADNALRNLKVAERNAYSSDMQLLGRAWTEANVSQCLSVLNRYRDRDDLRGLEWNYWAHLADAGSFQLAGHNRRVTDVAFSPDGTQLASAGWDSVIKVSDVATGKLQFTLKGHSIGINSVAFSPDGTRLATAAKDRTVKVWDIGTRKEVLTLKGHTKTVNCARFSPDGASLVSASDDGTMKVWDVDSGKAKSTIKLDSGPVRSVAFSFDGMTLASVKDTPPSSQRMSTLEVWNTTTWQVTATFPMDNEFAEGVSFSPDGSWLAIAGSSSVRVLDAATMQELINLTGNDLVRFNSVSFSPDGSRLVSAGLDNTVAVWDVATGQKQLELTGHTNEVVCASFSPDGTKLASGGYDRSVRVWNAVIERGELTLESLKQGEVKGVSLSPDSTRLVSVTNRGILRVWDVDAGQKLLELTGHTAPANAVSFSPDGTRFVTCSGDVRPGSSETEPGQVKLWDATTGREIITLNGHTGPVTRVTFSPDGLRLASASWDQTIKVWDVATGEEILTLKIDKQTGVYGLVFSSDGTMLAAASDGTTVQIWDAQTGIEKLTVKKKVQDGVIHGLSFAPDGKTICTAHSSGSLRWWDVETGAEIPKSTGHSGGVRSIAFSSDGTRLLSGGQDNLVKVWEVASGRETLTLKGHTHHLTSLSLSADGTRLASGSRDKTVKIWDMRPWTPEMRVQSRCRGYLTVHRERAESLESLRTYIRDDKTISEMVRQQCQDWAELFWKNRESAGK